MVGAFRIMPSSIAFLYQLMEKWGTEGGLMENLPEMEMWGSFSFGSDQEKLNLLLIAEMALDTACFFFHTYRRFPGPLHNGWHVMSVCQGNI